MGRVIVDGKEIEIGAEERLNGIQAARRAGVDIPHYCWHAGLSVVASCRMCLVETGRKNPDTGEIAMLPKVVPACQTPATDGTVFVTGSEKVQAAREMVEEDLLLRHPVDCPICDKAGECSLQDYHFSYGRDQRRADVDPFSSRRRPVGETVTLFVDRCVMCTRCVRFTREITGTSELMVVNRGAREEIDTFPGFPLDNKMSGNVVDLCPVGALGDVDFLYSQRVWFMKRHAGVCAGCSTGCSVQIEENQDRIYRLKPRENPHVNHWWMCDEGRYGFKYVHDARRLTQPVWRDRGEERALDWTQADSHIESLVKNPRGLTLVLSPFLTVEEAYLLATYTRQAQPQTVVAVGPIPSSGTNERFPNGFVIRSEKCPNRRGVEEIARRMQGRVIPWEEVVQESAPGATIWWTGGYPDLSAVSVDDAQSLADGRPLIVQDLFPSALTQYATLVLPSAAWAERAGSFVNAKDRLQSFDWAVRPPQGVQAEGQLYWRLAGRTGLYQPGVVLQELGSEIGYFAAALDSVASTGVDLKMNQLAGAVS